MTTAKTIEKQIKRLAKMAQTVETKAEKRLIGALIAQKELELEAAKVVKK